MFLPTFTFKQILNNNVAANGASQMGQGMTYGKSRARWASLTAIAALSLALAPSAFAAPAHASALPLVPLASSAAAGVEAIAGDKSVTLRWTATSGARHAAYGVSWRKHTFKNGQPTKAWAPSWSGLSELRSSARSHKVTGLKNGVQYQFRLETKANPGARWVFHSVVAAIPFSSVPSCANGLAACVVGDVGPGGGKVFYAPGGRFTETGSACGSSCRYLEAAPANWATAGSPDPLLAWGLVDSAGNCGSVDIPGAGGLAIGDGQQNTTAIVTTAACYKATKAPAAWAANLYNPTVNAVSVGGWFLPSLGELNALDISHVGGLAPYGSYWSSSQKDAIGAWHQFTGYAGGEDAQYYIYKYYHFLVRPIRAF